MSELTVFLRGYTVDVNIAKVFVQKPMGTRADSDADCYGYSELDFEVLAVWNDEDERMDAAAAQEYADNNNADIIDMIWSELERKS